MSSAGYSSSRERRAGGYGGFYENGSAASSASFQSSEQQFRPSSRPRRYDTETGTAGSIGGGRDETRYGDRGKSQDRNRSDATSGRSGPQPIDGMFRYTPEGTRVVFTSHFSEFVKPVNAAHELT